MSKNSEEVTKLLEDIKKSAAQTGDLQDHMGLLQKNLDKAEEVICEACKSSRFIPFFYLKKLDKDDSPSGKNTLFPLQGYECARCSHVNEIFIKQNSYKEE